MSNRPRPNFNCQSPISSIAVSEENDLIATSNYADELEIRRISDQKILYRKAACNAAKMHFCGDNLLMYNQYRFALLDWKNNVAIKKEDGFIFTNLKYYLTYQNGFFQLRSLFENVVYWQNKHEKPDSFSAKMTKDFLLIKTIKNNNSVIQLWNFKLNKKIYFQNIIKKNIDFEIDFEQFTFDYTFKLIEFLNDGRNLLIEQYTDDCWRIIILSLESFCVVANEVLDHSAYLLRENFTQIHCYKDSFYYLYKNNEIRYYNLPQKTHFAISINLKYAKYFNDFFIDERHGVIYILCGKNEILTLDLNSGLQFMIKFELPYRIDETTLFTAFAMYASSFTAGLIKVNLKTNERMNICYDSDEVQGAFIIKDKLLIISKNQTATSWCLSTNKIIKRVSLKKEKNKHSLLKELTLFDKNLNFDNSGICYLKNENDLLTLNKTTESISYSCSSTQWTKQVPSFFHSPTEGLISQKILKNCTYISKESLYKINLTNGEIDKLDIFKRNDYATCLQIEGDYIFVGTEGFCIFIIDLKRFKLLHKISTGHESPHSFIYCPNRNFLFVASHYSQEITIYDVLTSKEIYSWQGHKDILCNLFYLENQNVLLSVSRNGSLRKWDYNTFELLDEYYSLPAMPDKKYRKGWAHIDTTGKLRGSIHHKKYFDD